MDQLTHESARELLGQYTTEINELSKVSEARRLKAGKQTLKELDNFRLTVLPARVQERILLSKSERKETGKGSDEAVDRSNEIEDQVKAVNPDSSDFRPPYLTLKELSKLMQWKLTRGKFRPRLQGLVDRNSDEKVEEITADAFQQIDQIQALELSDEKAIDYIRRAIGILCKLDGVGPATASLILSVYPNSDQKERAIGDADSVDCLIPFFSDELWIALKGSTPIEYKTEPYIQLAREVSELSSGLLFAANEVESIAWVYTRKHKTVKSNKRAAEESRKLVKKKRK